MTKVLPPQVRDSRLASQRVEKSDLVPERELHHLKWFDYRFMTPLQATEQFRLEFQKVYRLKFRKNVNSSKADKVTGVSAAYRKTEWTAFWRARQFADELGVPYKIFLWPAFEMLLESGWQRIPYINQLYGPKNRDRIVAAVAKHWAEYRTTQLCHSALPQYREESFLNLPAQIAHREWVLGEVRQVYGGHPWPIGSACFAQRTVPEEQVIAEFGKERVDRGREYAVDEEPVPHEPVDPSDLLRSC